MNKEVKVLAIPREKNFGLDEQAVMVLLLVAAVVQIVCAFGAGPGVAKHDAPATTSIVQLHDGPMFAKK